MSLTHPDLGKYPFPQRKDLMSLSTISNKDARPQPTRGLSNPAFRESNSLSTLDIVGARPRMKEYEFAAHSSLSLRTDDIDKARSKTLHRNIKKPNYSLDVSDIATKNRRFQTNRESGNPLQPNYKLPSVEFRELTPPKFIRDNMDYQDVEGSKPSKYFKWQPRKTNDISDIDGAKCKPEEIFKRENFMNVKDINGTHDSFRTTRQVDPLNPTYKIAGEDGKLVEIGHVERSTPKPIIRNIKRGFTNLDTGDIDGAKASTLGKGAFKTRDRRDYKKTNKMDDIPGTSVNSLKRGLQTKRIVDPNNPEYVLIGNKEEEFQKEFKRVTAKKAESISAAEERKAKVNQIMKTAGFKASEYKFHGLNPSTDFTEGEKKRLEAEQYKRNYATFHGMTVPEVGTKEYAELPNPKAGLDPKFARKKAIRQKEVKVPVELQQDPSFQRNLAVFHGENAITSPRDEFSQSASKFFQSGGGAKNKAEVLTLESTVPAGHKVVETTKKSPIDVKDPSYKENLKAFHGLDTPTNRNNGETDARVATANSGSRIGSSHSVRSARPQTASHTSSLAGSRRGTAHGERSRPETAKSRGSNAVPRLAWGSGNQNPASRGNQSQNFGQDSKRSVFSSNLSSRRSRPQTAHEKINKFIQYG
eukprot:CAMPEP_0115018228 /NCGR_PEP_ID=MMETSP0216-20121206/28657_1 /TAXON_ID=223996 /ORGANISM="Protocruzia adherens, Strain Boccale" /LENGTH=642 /DNA_ID=CAMNT_0002389335 /DNA_START=30 /DNA_END=1958 /DNA_ORIENTATION=-